MALDEPKKRPKLPSLRLQRLITKMMNMNTEKNSTLLIPRKLANLILAHAQQNPETEICGLISTQNNQAKHYYPVPNVAPNTATLFKMDERAHISTM